MKNKKLKILGLTALGLMLFSFRKKTSSQANSYGFYNPLASVLEIRNCDPAGCGHYNAPRGERLHKGIDIVVYPGQSIYAPISGTVRRFFAYENNTDIKGIEITNGNTKVKLFYVNSSLQTGDVIEAQTKIGVAQDIAGYYNSSTMTPHIHTEVLINNQKVDPTNYFKF